MKRTLALLLCLLVPTIVFASNSNGYKVMYDGGSLPNIKTGAKLELRPGEKDIHFSQGGQEVKVILPPSQKSATDRTSIGASVPPSVLPSSALEWAHSLHSPSRRSTSSALLGRMATRRAASPCSATRTTTAASLPVSKASPGKKAVDSDAMTVKN